MNDRVQWLEERRKGIGARTPLAVRFAAKCAPPDAGGCILWRGAVNKNGYGSINLGGKGGRILTASRVAWELANGPVPAGMLVCHSCDRPLCMAPEHLFLGTNLDNRLDAKAKGRAHGAIREHNSHAKLTPDQVDVIKKSLICTKDLAATYGVNRTTIQRIRAGTSWR